MTRTNRGQHRHALTMLSLILAGEAIFVPPFHLGRYFKSSLLASFHIDEFQLGQLGAIYGIVAMACYFLGGPLADRVSPRKLLPASLLATGLGSLYMSTLPSFTGLYGLYAFWGASTILLFWAPLIRSTREWGGTTSQGRAFGILDGGRGLTAALVAALAAFIFAAMVGTTVAIDPAHRILAIRSLLCSYAGLCLLAAAGAWIFVPDPRTEGYQPTTKGSPHGLSHRLGLVLRTPATWLQAIVIVAAYSAFKMFDNYGLYAEDAYHLSPVDSAKVTAYLSFLRAGATVAAGWIADRWLRISSTIQMSFGLLLVSYGSFLVVEPGSSLVWFMIANMAVSCCAFFALRGIYFGLLEESKMPKELTGTAVGIISFIGFTPEIFMPPLTGWFISRARSAGDVLAGYDQIFGVLLALSALGLLSAVVLRRLEARPSD